MKITIPEIPPSLKVRRAGERLGLPMNIWLV